MYLDVYKRQTIYHAGDLNNWVWEGEPEADNRRMSENFHREMDKLAGRHIDVDVYKRQKQALLKGDGRTWRR